MPANKFPRTTLLSGINVLLTFDFEEWEGKYAFYEADLFTKTQRIVKLLLEHDVAATFFLDAYTCLQYPNAVRLVHDGGYELALHSDYHPGAPAVLTENGPPQLVRVPHFEQDAETQIRRMQRAIVMIRRVIPDFKPRGFRAPNLKWNEALYDALSKMRFSYDSSQKNDSFQPFMKNGVTVIPVNCGDYDSACYKMRPQYVVAVWKGNIERARRAAAESGLAHFVILAHPSVSGKSRYLCMLKAILNHLSWMDVKFLTCGGFDRAYRSHLSGER
jgi:peptidoglycan/xylan/chitin deacetylase (PgdA/CDA1 family)